MDQVTIKAVVAAHGLPKNARVTVAETPLVAGALRNGVFKLIERHPAETPDDGTSQAETLGRDAETDGTSQAETVGRDAETDPLDVPPFDDPEVAADNSTVVPSHQPGTRKRRG